MSRAISAEWLAEAAEIRRNMRPGADRRRRHYIALLHARMAREAALDLTPAGAK